LVHNTAPGKCVTKTVKSLKTATGKTISNSKHRGKLNPRAKKLGYNVPVKKNGYPDFSKYLYKPLKGQKNSAVIEMTGKYGDDFAAANKRAGLSKTPTGYTWHHTEQVKTMNGKTYNKLVLVETGAHDAARHLGGAQIYRGMKGNSGAY
jgi:hypothetical protein